MKTNRFLLSAILGLLTLGLFAQVNKANYRAERQTPQHNFSQTENDATPISDHFSNRENRGELKPDFWAGDKWMKNTENTDGLVYICDSAISYSTNGDMTCTKYTRDAEGRTLVYLTKIWNSGYGL